MIKLQKAVRKGTRDWIFSDFEVSEEHPALDIAKFFGLDKTDVQQITIDDVNIDEDRTKIYIFYNLENLSEDGVTGKIGNNMFCSPILIATGDDNGKLLDYTKETDKYFDENAQLF